MKFYIVRTVDKNWDETVVGIFESYESADMFGVTHFDKNYKIEEYPVHRFNAYDMSKPGDKDYDV